MGIRNNKFWESLFGFPINKRTRPTGGFAISSSKPLPQYYLRRSDRIKTLSHCIHVSYPRASIYFFIVCSGTMYVNCTSQHFCKVEDRIGCIRPMKKFSPLGIKNARRPGEGGTRTASIYIVQHSGRIKPYGILATRSIPVEKRYIHWQVTAFSPWSICHKHPF
jgi:hypothetical protein